MIRFLVLALIGLLLLLLVRAAVAAFVSGFSGRSRPGGAPRALRDELVKDPVCETYVPRRSALTRTAGGATYYFCGPACAEKFRGP